LEFEIVRFAFSAIARSYVSVIDMESKSSDENTLLMLIKPVLRCLCNLLEPDLSVDERLSAVEYRNGV